MSARVDRSGYPRVGLELTGREWEVAIALARDKTVKEIAAHLGVSAKTVEYYWGRIKAKVGVRSHVGLLRWMVERWGLP
jgi:DNA-binding NarL/FixJ family response regulator